MRKTSYDIIVIGGGHTGCEAALASARMGCKTLLLNLDLDTIGLMSCNPAIGGIGKGQLVKEIDALGGEMAKATDACGIQFRVLNASKGPAVQSSRAQVDRRKYLSYMQNKIKNQKNLHLLEAEATGLIVNNKVVKGIKINKGEKISAKAVIISPGTFLNGLIHIGMKSFPGGRIEERKTSKTLSKALKNLGFHILRFKTGTCARLDGKTIKFSKLRIQPGDKTPRPFSFSTEKITIKQVPCYITHTNKNTHDIILNNLDKSPLYSGKIIGTGVRYCPSLEDKVVKFPHHQTHQVFLEPEGLDTDEFYPNGLSTSLPEDVQEAFIRSVPGLAKVKINRFGYGIEHDAIDSRELFPTLESKLVSNLYLAGQINGTTGYEEAAAQGLMAGINAVLKIKKKPPLMLDRATSYIGVLIDDLVTKGTNEPYRMFTSRVEYRLLLREDNADLRLGKFSFEAGLLSKKRYKEVQKKEERIRKTISYLKNNKISYKNKKVSLYQLLKRPEIKIENFKDNFPFDYSPGLIRAIEAEVKYAGYIQRQLAEVRGFKNLEKIKLSPALNYKKIPSLSLEISEKLSRLKPLNLGQASRISGVTPAAITILMVYLRKNQKSPREIQGISGTKSSESFQDSRGKIKNQNWKKTKKDITDFHNT